MGWLPVLLCINAGFLDTAGYLLLHGLFPAHVTGNLATLGAALVLGSGGVVGKLAALPMFMLGVTLTALAGAALGKRGLRWLLGLNLALLAAFTALAVAHGPFARPDSPAELAAGLLAVAAMAVQNGAQHRYLPQSPLTTAMTGNTVTALSGLIDLWRGAAPAPERTRLLRSLGNLAGFVAGATAAAGLCWLGRDLCLLVPPLLGLLAVLASV